MILYKYFPCNEYTFKSLAMKGLWCHTYNHMNDPFECLNILDRVFSSTELNDFRLIMSKSKNKKFSVLTNLDDDELTEIINEFRKTAINKFGFSSLSEDSNNILMWSHYANDHKGIVIGFEFPELEGNTNLQKVKYKDSLNEIKIKDFAHFLIADCESDYYHSILMKDYSLKACAWDYEKEWRIWRSKPCYYHFKPEQVKEVWFGLNTSNETIAVLLGILNYLPNNTFFEKKIIKYNPLRIE